MSERLKLDLTKKEAWKTIGPSDLALYFGYCPDENFSAALRKFVKETVDQATVTLYLATLAKRFFSNWQPPLTPLDRKDGRFY